jgi:hypothetical protein
MGELADIGVADLLFLLAIKRQTGKLTVNASGDEVGIFLDQGRMVQVSSSNSNLRLGRMLIRLGYLGSEQLREGLRHQEQSRGGRQLGKLLVERGVISEQELAKCVEEQCIEILARVISATTGVFLFDRGATPSVKAELVPLNSDRIMLEATRRTDDLAALRSQLPSADAVLMLNPAIDRLAEQLSDVEIYVAATLQAGASTLRELSERLAMDDLSLWRTVISLRSRGLLTAGREAAMNVLVESA